MLSAVFLGLRDLIASKGRFVLVGVVIGLVAFLATMLSGLANGLVDDGISGMRALPLSHLAYQDNAHAVFSRSILTPESLEPYQAADGVEATPIGVSFFNASPADGEGNSIDLALFGVDGDGFLAEASAGDTADLGAAVDGGLVLSDKLSDEVTVGEEFTIVGTDITLPVVGFTFAGTFGHVPIAYTSLDTWQTLLYGDDANGRFSAVALRADGAALNEIGEVEGVELYTKKGAYAGSPGYSAESSTMTLIRGFLLVISALVVGAFFTVWTIQRTRQIGLLKALGASSWYVIRDALGQLAILLAISITLGCLVALVTGSFVGDDVPFNLTAGSTITTALVLAVVGMAGSLVALRRITSVDPSISLSSAP